MIEIIIEAPRECAQISLATPGDNLDQNILDFVPFLLKSLQNHILSPALGRSDTEIPLSAHVSPIITTTDSSFVKFIWELKFKPKAMDSCYPSFYESSHVSGGGGGTKKSHKTKKTKYRFLCSPNRPVSKGDGSLERHLVAIQSTNHFMPRDCHVILTRDRRLCHMTYL